MAENKKEDRKVVHLRSPKIKPQLRSIEDIAKRLKVKPHIFAGLKVFCGWAEDTRVSQAEFEKKLALFLRSPINIKPISI